jgi:uncharacterized protein (DUF1778 family)
MTSDGHRLTAAGRVNEDQMARIDAAAHLERVPRAHFVVRATLAEAERVLRRAVGQDTESTAGAGS